MWDDRCRCKSPTKPPDRQRTLLDYLCTVANLHEIHFLWRPTLPDPGDDLVLDLAANAGCRYIVTYNKRHFKGAETFGIESVTAKELLSIIGALS